MEIKEYEELLNDVETRLDRLRALYEQYFQGIERLEPSVPKKEVERRMQLLRKSQPRNTALRFRTQQVIQKYTTYLTYWTRVARQIEEGTFRRDVIKARQRRVEARDRRRQERDGSIAPDGWDIDIDVDADAGIAEAIPQVERKSVPSISPLTLPSVRPSQGKSHRPISPFAIPKTPKPGESGHPGSPQTATFARPREGPGTGTQRSFGLPAGARPAVAGTPQRVGQNPQPTSKPGGPVDIRDVYDKYIEARRRNNERTDNVRYETIEKSIQQMLPRLQEKHHGKRIDFEVVVKDGTVGLKPVPK